MSYTLERKREALVRNELWWRLPNELGAGDRAWSLCFSHGCISCSEAEYHIGPTAPTPPRVLSELEGELLEALNELLIDMRLAQTNMRAAAKRDPAWEGCAEAIQPRVDAAIAAIKKAESTP